ncbi:MAG: PIN domain-containing protein [Spirochaetes bacterium]|nr:PIN domain-containing protein [Spirochaetota bacterium]
MSYVVDTHYLIWSLVSPEQIPAGHVSILENADHTKYVSNISFWEISLKFGLGKLRLAGVTPEEIVDAAVASGFAVLGVTTEQLASSYRLEYVGQHKDPFDRLLIWQCIKQDFLLLTADAEIQQYSSIGLRLG